MGVAGAREVAGAGCRRGVDGRDGGGHVGLDGHVVRAGGGRSATGRSVSGRQVRSSGRRGAVRGAVRADCSGGSARGTRRGRGHRRPPHRGGWRRRSSQARSARRPHRFVLSPSDSPWVARPRRGWRRSGVVEGVQGLVDAGPEQDDERLPCPSSAPASWLVRRRWSRFVAAHRAEGHRIRRADVFVRPAGRDRISGSMRQVVRGIRPGPVRRARPARWGTACSGGRRSGIRSTSRKDETGERGTNSMRLAALRRSPRSTHPTQAPPSTATPLVHGSSDRAGAWEAAADGGDPNPSWASSDGGAPTNRPRHPPAKAGGGQANQVRRAAATKHPNSRASPMGSGQGRPGHRLPGTTPPGDSSATGHAAPAALRRRGGTHYRGGTRFSVPGRVRRSGRRRPSVIRKGCPRAASCGRRSFDPC